MAQNNYALNSPGKKDLNQEIRNKIIDEIILALNVYNYTDVSSIGISEKYNISEEQMDKEFLILLQTQGIINPYSIAKTHWILTEYGEDIKNRGGFIKIKEEGLRKNELNELKQKLEIKNLKWVLNTRWLPLILALFSLIISIIALFKD